MSNVKLLLLFPDLPEVKLSLGSTLNPLEIKEGTDVYFECRIRANPKITRLAWFFNVSWTLIAKRKTFLENTT